MAQDRTATVTYTEEIVRDAVRTFVWRQGIANQKGLWVTEAVMIALLAWLLWSGERGWLVGVLGVIVLLPPGLIVAIWVAHHRNTVGKFRRMTTRRADFAFLNDGLEIMSELGTTKISWTAITGIWEKPDYWMIFIAPNQFVTLPMQTISAADRDFLRSKTSSAISRKF